jgi:large subunit ribosomal protein L20
MKAGLNAYIGRKRKKRDFRRLWNARINISARLNGTTYSKLIGAMYSKKVKLNRKVLSNLAITNPTIFTNVVNFTK